MGPPLGPTLANAFLVYHEKNWLEHCPLEYRLLYYRRYVDETFVLFNSPEHHKRFHSYLNSCHLKISFHIENEKEQNLLLSIITKSFEYAILIFCLLIVQKGLTILLIFDDG